MNTMAMLEDLLNRCIAATGRAPLIIRATKEVRSKLWKEAGLPEESLPSFDEDEICSVCGVRIIYTLPGEGIRLMAIAMP